MKFVAFFRNLNLGRKNCPDRTQFETAFREAGAQSAKSFLTNGTMVFEARTQRSAHKVLAGACEALGESCGLEEPAFLRRIQALAELVALDPFVSIAPGSVYECCVTFLHAPGNALSELPAQSSRGDVRIVRCTRTEVLSVSLKIGKSPGSPNAFLEKTLKQPASTRSWNTVLRLVRAHA